MLLRLQTPNHSADMVSTGENRGYREVGFFSPYFSTKHSNSCTLSGSDAEEEYDRTVQSVCESTFDKA